MQKFRDVNEVRDALKSAIPLNEFIELVDGKPLIKMSDQLYKKKCELDEHQTDDDGTKDSTASFTVCPPKSLWYCFGCAERGDMFEYISRKMHVDHNEAIRISAQIIGFDISPFYEEQTQEEIVKDSLFKENNMAREIAHTMLMSNREALDYLLGRGISIDSIKEFKIGYAPRIASDRVDVFDMVANSVALQLNRKDQFNHAILFPISDTYGRMRYFQSRPFNSEPGKKYIGCNDSHPLFDETDRLYGFNIAKKNLKRLGGKLVGVEGAPDAIVCNQNNIPTVAFMGTAVNQKTMDLLDRFRVQELVLLLDGDRAGRDRSIKICEKFMQLSTSIRLRVAMLPDGYDPDEFINKFGAGELIDIINKSPYYIQHLIDTKWDESAPDTATKKMEFMWSVQSYVVGITDTIIRNIVIQHIATKLGFDPIQISDYYAKVESDSGFTMYSSVGEEILLGEVMRNPEFILELNTIFGDNDWYLAKHKYLYKILKTAQYFDPDSIAMTTKNLKLDHIIPLDWLNRLYHTKPDNIDFHLHDVEDKLIRRKAMAEMGTLSTMIKDMTFKPEDILDKSVIKIYDIISRHSDNGISNGQQQVDNTMAIIHERMKNPGNIIGYDLGPNFKRITQAWLGIEKKTLTIVSANQSVGKTQLCENWAMYQSVFQQLPVGWFTLEMDAVRMTYRHLSILSGVPAQKIMTGNLSLDEKRMVDESALRLRQSPFYMSEKGTDLSESLSIARRFVKTNNVGILYVDYLQLQYVSDKYTSQRHRELGIISKAWKQFAKDMNVAVVGISQLSKDALSAEIAKAEHGAGSYEIAQDADNYLTLKERSAEEIKKIGMGQGNIIANIAKNRMGEKEILVNIYADRQIHRMMEI